MKKILTLLVALTMIFVIAAACAPADEAPAPAPAPEADAPAAPAADRPFRVGITIQSLANTYWAGVFGVVDELLAAKGWEYTILDCSDNAAIQIDQIENFIIAEKDLIMVHPADPEAIVDVSRRARDAGIILMSWDDILPDGASDLNWVLDNTALGFEIGRAAAEFINEHYTEENPAKVAVINFPQLPILLERENGILAALEEFSPGRFEVVAAQPAVDAGTALNHIETILQAHPDLTVVVSIGAGGDIGANEAFMTLFGGNIPEYVGIFSADASQQQLESILAGEASRVTVGFEGSSRRTAEAVVDLYEQLLLGADLPLNLVRPLLPIGAHNAATYLADYTG